MSAEVLLVGETGCRVHHISVTYRRKCRANVRFSELIGGDLLYISPLAYRIMLIA